MRERVRERERERKKKGKLEKTYHTRSHLQLIWNVRSSGMRRLYKEQQHTHRC